MTSPAWLISDDDYRCLLTNAQIGTLRSFIELFEHVNEGLAVQILGTHWPFRGGRPRESRREPR